MMKLPQYTNFDKWIFLGAMPVFIMLVNWLFFGSVYFTDLVLFAEATILTLVILGLSWLSLTWIAVTLRNRLPKDSEIMQRMGIALSLFIIITALTLTLIYTIYSSSLWSYEPDEIGFRWVLFTGVIVNIFVTLLHEGVSGFEKWKATLTETEALKKEYLQSRLLGLKSQLNPHFLFNSLNSLSSLIHENAADAEKFLDEMSKVYRYLLKNSDEQLVTLETELNFVRSYFHLLKTRHGEGIKLVTDIPADEMEKYLPPFTMQILLDIVFNEHVINKEHPLTFEISTTSRGWLQIKNNAQRKISDDPVDRSGIQNMSNKFRLLCNKSIIVKDTGTHQVMQVPLINEAEILIA